MTLLTRRALIGHSAATAAITTFASGALLAAPVKAAEPAVAPALFVFDARFARSAALAGSHGATGIALLDPRKVDLGIAWREQIPALLRQGQRIEGLTLWSDRMICEIFARDMGVPFAAEDVSAGEGTATRLQHWWLG
jgi:IS5 family transposase